MKDIHITLKDENPTAKKNNRFQKRISLRHWLGWSGSYSSLKKKP